MGTMSSYEHGQFSWVDLTAHDIADARTFYESLFGWSAVDSDTQGGPPYVIFELEGHKLAGLAQMPEEMKAQGIPPTWNNYINVDDINATTEKAVALGGTNTMPVMKVLDAGSLAFIQDPSGAHVGLWQKDKFHGADRVNDPGYFGWNELHTRDVDKAKTFFSELFGWEFELSPDSPHPYHVIMNKGRMNGGILEMNEEWDGFPPHWTAYFTVTDADAIAGKAKELGGKMCVEPFDLSFGRMAVISDPQGGTFCVIAMNDLSDLD
ncbi:27 kDa antigen Cfp30B [Planctomycetes bacterium Pan216]|uniref:27 kDa antigen Cfp30B n=1 Tax=Kolteria novifilia TaxID=2527975 RepID=A0A518BBC7_9BACT|nr:27 kDa antigen Cfp30B [Planctomycetes bacterium Pan216]